MMSPPHDKPDLGKTPLRLLPFGNGGWCVLDDQARGSGRSEVREIAAFTNSVDLIEWLAENLIPDPVPEFGAEDCRP